MLVEHGMQARGYPDVRANTIASFALNDYEWVLAFEADELHRIVDLMRELRGVEGADARARGGAVLHRPARVGARPGRRASLSRVAGRRAGPAPAAGGDLRGAVRRACAAPRDSWRGGSAQRLQPEPPLPHRVDHRLQPRRGVAAVEVHQDHASRLDRGRHRVAVTHLLDHLRRGRPGPVAGVDRPEAQGVPPRGREGGQPRGERACPAGGTQEPESTWRAWRRGRSPAARSRSTPSTGPHGSPCGCRSPVRHASSPRRGTGWPWPTSRSGTSAPWRRSVSGSPGWTVTWGCRPVVVERQPHVRGVVPAGGGPPVRRHRHVRRHAARDRDRHGSRRQRRRAPSDRSAWRSRAAWPFPVTRRCSSTSTCPRCGRRSAPTGCSAAPSHRSGRWSAEVMATGNVTVTVTGLTVPSLTAA